MTPAAATTGELAECGHAAVMVAALRAADAAVVLVLSQDGVVCEVSEGLTALLGWRTEEVKGQRYAWLTPQEPSATSAALGSGALLHGRVLWRTKEGFTRALRLRSAAVLGAADQVVGTVVVATDASMVAASARRSERKTQEQLRRAFEVLPSPVAVVSLSPATRGVVRQVNTAFEVFTGRDRSDLMGVRLAQLLHPEEVPSHLAHLQMAVFAGVSVPAGVERRFMHVDGHTVWARKSTAVIAAGDGSTSQEPQLLVQLHDLTEQRAATEALAHAALHDPLTGLANRSLFTDRLELALAADRRARVGVSLLYLDLDDFKFVNDRYGHAAGDAVLIEVADRLRAAVRAEDTVARLGADEFAVICPGLDMRFVPVVLARIRRLLMAPVQLVAGPPLEVGWSLGVAVVLASEGTGVGDRSIVAMQEQSGEVGVLLSPSAQEFLGAADALMFMNKRSRRRHG